MPSMSAGSLTDILRSKILKNELKSGERLPSESQLCENYNLSRQSVRQAIEQLRKEGLVNTIQGSGTYVMNLICDEVNSSSISVILPYDDDYIFASFISSIHSTLTKYGYIVEMHITHNNLFKEEAALMATLNNPRVGIIIDPAKSQCPRLHLELYQKIRDMKIPCIAMNSAVNGMDFPVVAMDDVMAGSIATRYLISKGHTRIGMLCNSDSIPGQLRLKGHLCEMESSGLADEVGHIIYYCSEDEDVLFGGQFDQYIINMFSECTAVICFNDRVAAKLNELLKKNNIRVPEDISIIGHDDALISRYITPKLTTIEHMKSKLGMIAADNLVKLIKNPEFEAGCIMTSEIVERESVKNLSAVKNINIFG